MNRPENRDNILVKGGENLTTGEFENLLGIYGDDVYRFCMYIMRNRENADDLYQETVLTAFRKAETLELSENPRSYLLSVAVKLSHNFFRKEKRKSEHTASPAPEMLDNLADDTDVQADAEKAELRAAIRQAVSELDEKYRVPVVLYYFDEQNLTYISEIMKLPPGTVKSRLHRARELLAAKLEKEVSGNG